MYNQNEWEERELVAFRRQNNKYFDSVKDFNENLENSNIEEDLEWIANGTYGAGACLALKKTFEGLNNRMNKRARVGQVLLKALYGADFRYWSKLSPDVQEALNKAVDKWIAKPNKDFAL
jgi:hypothetical protein